MHGISGIDSSTPLRVLQVTPRYPPYTGGVENHVYEVARRLASRNIDISVLTTDPSGQLPASECTNGVKITRVKAWPADRDYYFAPGIYRIINEVRWDILHVQSYHTLVPPIAMLAALRAGIPYIVTFHGGGHSSRLRNSMRRMQLALLRPMLARARKLIAVARFEIGYYGQRLNLPAERFAYIPNGADLPKVGRVESSAAGEGTLIASVGRLERYKGHHRIISALPKILEQQPDVRLWIAGSGSYEDELRRLAIKTGVAEHVEIRAIPATERERMATELARTRLVVLLSEYETQPIAVLEAIALGCSVLVADTSGLSELAQQGLARAIPLASTDNEVAAAILQQLRQPIVPTGLKLASWDDTTNDLLALYKSIVK